ncbi:hypothetical protein P692DRAFT_20880861 [Suillus brevipes Sb2]|nr:hypothetical protein P692DRAFT_20880861 [Suillus brevipes Sb2]
MPMAHSTKKARHFGVVSGHSARWIQLHTRSAALLLGLAQPVGDSEVPDPAGEYSIKYEDFFQNLKESDEEKESEPWGKHRGIMEQ